MYLVAPTGACDPASAGMPCRAGQPAEDSRRSQSGYRAANVTTAYVRKDAHGTMLRNHCSLRDVRQTCKNLFKDL
jgi:hypothetical protein